ncbi:MAG: ATP-binding cassette domain-containing protein, partial [Candidatus Omnitrophica bacterium]|nr:ATP-binding cassette domain-containing protein [Candidatus Omnitrophota bacterium]
MNELMEVNSITKVYNSGVAFTAIKDISLSVCRQDYLAIVGPSGAGKSTLLHVMGGLEPPTRGEVFFIEKNLYRMKDWELSLWRNKTVGFVFQF